MHPRRERRLTLTPPRRSAAPLPRRREPARATLHACPRMDERGSPSDRPGSAARGARRRRERARLASASICRPRITSGRPHAVLRSATAPSPSRARTTRTTHSSACLACARTRRRSTAAVACEGAGGASDVGSTLNKSSTYRNNATRSSLRHIRVNNAPTRSRLCTLLTDDARGRGGGATARGPRARLRRKGEPCAARRALYGRGGTRPTRNRGPVGTAARGERPRRCPP